MPWRCRDELLTERNNARQDLTLVVAEVKKQRALASDVLKLRNEITLKRREMRNAGLLTPELLLQTHSGNDGVAEETLRHLLVSVQILKQRLEQIPEQQVPELCLLEEHDWIKAARGLNANDEEEVLTTLARARTLAKEKLIPMLSIALQRFVKENEGLLPSSLPELKSYLEHEVDDSIFDRYVLVKTGHSRELSPGEPIIREKDRLTPYDTRFSVGLGGWGANGPPKEKSKNAAKI
jgi:hypothetical protein